MEIRGAGRIARAAAGALRDHALSLRTGDDLPGFVAEMETGGRDTLDRHTTNRGIAPERRPHRHGRA